MVKRISFTVTSSDRAQEYRTLESTTVATPLATARVRGARIVSRIVFAFSFKLHLFYLKNKTYIYNITPYITESLCKVEG